MCYNTVLMSYMICLQAAKQKKISTKKTFLLPIHFFGPLSWETNYFFGVALLKMRAVLDMHVSYKFLH